MSLSFYFSYLVITEVVFAIGNIHAAVPQSQIYDRGWVSLACFRSNFGGLVLGCVDSYDSNQMLILQGFSRSTRISKWIFDFLQFFNALALGTVFFKKCTFVQMLACLVHLDTPPCPLVVVSSEKSGSEKAKKRRKIERKSDVLHGCERASSGIASTESLHAEASSCRRRWQRC